ncbi:fibrobacter succinogenes major domain (Fib_succ_major) [mine drainage metagenome]|uniref:Fibrobacter succinogenes major domain (Fib_succ_major) n=1 Tax=mine drainage metagenome TaxID=410659 RepID=A0A1J5PR83_9ZZZZ
MKKPLCHAIVSVIVLIGCSKKHTISPLPTPVIINGTSYPTVVIGNQTWTSMNYDGAGGMSLNNDPTQDLVYGKYYTVAESQSVQLPTGWRIPTANDFITLHNTVGGKQLAAGQEIVTDSTQLKLMSTTGWYGAGGSNTSGFNALPAGCYHQQYSYPSPSVFEGQQVTAVFLTSTQQSSTLLATSFFLYQQIHFFECGFPAYITSPTDRASLRFVRDN